MHTPNIKRCQNQAGCALLTALLQEACVLRSAPVQEILSGIHADSDGRRLRAIYVRRTLMRLGIFHTVWVHCVRPAHNSVLCHVRGGVGHFFGTRIFMHITGMLPFGWPFKIDKMALW